MNEFFKNLKQEALNTRLSHNEKQHMRVSLYDAMRKPQAVVQEVRVVRSVRSSYTWFSFISSPRFAMPVAVLLVMGLGTGTAFAAQGSLPGDILYPIKIHVNEEVEVALATTPAAKATVEEQIANRRVTEAQTLDAQGRLDATTTQEIEDNFDEHASRALAFRGEGSSATTSVKTMSVRHQPTLMAASTTVVVTSSEDDVTVSLRSQKNILNELKLRVGKRKHGKDNSGDSSGSKNDQHDGNTSTTSVSSTTLQLNTQTHVIPSASEGGKSGDSGDQDKNKGGDDSSVNHLLNNF